MAHSSGYPLPEGVDTSKVNASFKSGVLVVSVAKSPELKGNTRKFKVKVG